ncbi:peptide chain release factor N(5)-glutamine methyltransferase [Bosea vaviloviae]|uniref:Release factor glutamine methyltransferase n=1 Tax=Bosea vaviloviae TaxID=1526658 RepID=A0A1D7U083_9HYPH|nr:peptide chain release factor N(5)-glutamine methyltransferase [Bosea vaviloviae]AOO80781.1 protein-(glutamine-N5) methyltransferase, release factor-specific [Bosea vaviloviae]
MFDARRNLAARLREAGVETAAMDARILVEAAMGENADLDPLQPLDAAMLGRLDSFATRRLAGEPVWRILGEREFWSLPFRLSPATLEPRPDSETIVEAALGVLAERRDQAISILDLGTGTGCLLVALLSECKAARGVGVDLSEEACETAAGNAERNGVGARARFRQGDWMAGLSERFDLIVSNPPYIPAGDIAGLDAAVREHDPLRALDGGEDGLVAYRALAAGLPRQIAPGGAVVLEIGAGQEADVVAIMAAMGLVHRGSRRDLGGHTRALIFTLE